MTAPVILGILAIVFLVLGFEIVALILGVLALASLVL